MTRISSTIVIYMILMNGAVAIMEGSGLASDLGIQLAPGVNQSLRDLIETAKAGFAPGTGLGETLFALFAAAGKSFRVVAETAFAAPQALMNLGVPDYIVVAFAGPLYVIVLLEIVYTFTGRDLV